MEETESEETDAVVNVEMTSAAGGGYGREFIVATPPMLPGVFNDKKLREDTPVIWPLGRTMLMDSTSIS